MDKASIIEALEGQLNNINKAITALRGKHRQGRRGRTQITQDGASINGRRRHLSAAARKRIGEAMKKRWAERKKNTT